MSYVKIRHIVTGLYASEDLLSFNNQGHTWTNLTAGEFVQIMKPDMLLPRDNYEIVVFTETRQINLGEFLLV